MPRALRLVPVVAALLAAWPLAGAETTAPGAAATETASPPQPRAGVLSPRTLSMLRAATPRFDPAAANAPPAPPPDAPLPTDPSVVVLPKYVVLDHKLPRAEDVMTDKARAELAMNKYLGSRDGLDRGFLNRVTLPELWSKIPVLGKILPVPIPSVTNEQRALQRYYEDERLRRMNDLHDLANMTSASGNRELGERIRRETRDAFRNN